MPVARRATPPTSQIRSQLGVLNSLSAWTDTGEEDKPSNAKKNKYERLSGGEQSTQDVWKERLQMWMDPESDHFNMVIGLVIISNALVIGLETEFGAGYFTLFEHLFNVVFFTEMCLRLRLMGKAYFKEPWNCFDFALVFSGTLDLWVMPLVLGGGDTNNALYHFQAMRMLRMLRLMRVLRVIRLFRMFQQLFLIMQAFGKAFHIVLLMGLLVLILDYVIAIMLTQAIGHDPTWQGTAEEDKIQMYFGSIPNSMQTLFVIMTLTAWDQVSEVLVTQWPPMIVYASLVLYIMVTSYTMLSLITGIISESLITAQQEYRLRKEKTMEEKKKDISFELRQFLLSDCLEEDKDEHNNVNTNDLKTAMRGDTELLMKLASINIHVTEQAILSLIDKLATNEIVNIDYFVDKLLNLVGVATASSVMDMKYEISKLNLKMDAIMAELKIDPSAATGAGPAPKPAPKPAEVAVSMGMTRSHEKSDRSGQKPKFAD
mmetsp:Transcript_14836/g.32708  ORF Transcript_14836/g.32708 Transcript_14836/m.32708 type:complete len:487 (-) Transcript_14836:247-1707(-)|eukprot:CAMPEP_0206432826 /NCGR_PEP_ID=MMETSP0324_2-20121206/8182_1 /ASSEMBLY_ACC=CAM_ASM_000836 /TAXON_ID=2866 /ORGANISM="Crypthecodinium cohnii, Strain Seligo" /LENGTH=486 /DNA_ID=CAMNT_0053899001 /DNA_START=170 /DNA_END=1630 /DNA_ORIENTATION=+